MGGNAEVKRVWVIIAAIILLAFACIAVSQCDQSNNTFCLIVNILTIVGCVLGIVGAARLHPGMLNIFCITLLLLVILEVVFIIIAFVNNGVTASQVLWDFIVLGLLAITLAFAGDLRNAVSGALVMY